MQTISIKVIQATIAKGRLQMIDYLAKGRLEFSHMGQMFIDATESTANVNYITSVMQRK